MVASWFGAPAAAAASEWPGSRPLSGSPAPIPGPFQRLSQVSPRLDPTVPQRPQKLGNGPCSRRRAGSMTSEASLATAGFETGPCAWNCLESGPALAFVGCHGSWPAALWRHGRQNRNVGPRASVTQSSPDEPRRDPSLSTRPGIDPLFILSSPTWIPPAAIHHFFVPCMTLCAWPCVVQWRVYSVASMSCHLQIAPWPMTGQPPDWERVGKDQSSGLPLREGVGVVEGMMSFFEDLFLDSSAALGMIFQPTSKIPR